MLVAHHDKRCAAVGGEAGKTLLAATRAALGRKETLVQRPFDTLFEEPHVLSAWLSRNRGRFSVVDGRVQWKVNPVEVLADTYWLLNMDDRPGVPAAHVIWKHDQALLEAARGFYGRLEARLGALAWQELSSLLDRPSPPSGFDEALWRRVRGAHQGFQLGLELLGLLPLIGDRAGFYELCVEPDLEVHIPTRLTDPQLQARMKKVLSPPPTTRANEIVAVSGGMFYRQEAPTRPPFVEKGTHFEAGDPLYIIEVMKMFNRVLAPFAGTIDEILVQTDGAIVQKGQPLFRVTPDDKIVEEDEATRRARLRASTQRYMDALLRGVIAARWAVSIFTARIRAPSRRTPRRRSSRSRGTRPAFSADRRTAATLGCASSARAASSQRVSSRWMCPRPTRSAIVSRMRS
jgi:biotin carboxyl carrier protein